MHDIEFQSTNASNREFLRHGFDIFDQNNKLKIRGGEHVIILTTHGPGPAPVIGIIFPSDGSVSCQYKHFYGAGKLHRWNFEGKSYDANTTVPRSLDLEKNTQRWFNWQQQELRTVSGLPVRIITKDRRGERPYVGLVTDLGRHGERIVLYFPNGRTRSDGRETSLDLVNSPLNLTIIKE